MKQLSQPLERNFRVIALASSIFIVALSLPIERLVRLASISSQHANAILGREQFVPNYRHIWFAHDPVFYNSGNGKLDSLGSIIKSALSSNQSWRDICELDIDADGLTNGEELGDPCCRWTSSHAGASFSLSKRLEYRRWLITHPSAPNPVNETFPTLTQPQNCTDYDSEAYDMQFQSFYFRRGFEPEEDIPWKPIHVVKFLCLSTFLYSLANWIRYDDLAKDLAPWFHTSARVKTPASLLMCFAAFVYMDVTSGIIHLILDYCPHWIPAVGDLAKGFQYHHDDPTAIIRISWYEYASHIHLLIPLLILVMRVSDASRMQRLFWIWGGIWAHLFQTAHRWTHFPPERLPLIASVLQNTGLCLTSERHMQHHQDLERQFSILSGHSDVILDSLSQYIPPWRYDIWVLIGVGWFWLPPMLDILFRDIIVTLSENRRKLCKVDDIVEA